MVPATAPPSPPLEVPLPPVLPPLLLSPLLLELLSPLLLPLPLESLAPVLSLPLFPVACGVAAVACVTAPAVLPPPPPGKPIVPANPGGSVTALGNPNPVGSVSTDGIVIAEGNAVGKVKSARLVTLVPGKMLLNKDRAKPWSDGAFCACEDETSAMIWRSVR